MGHIMLSTLLIFLIVGFIVWLTIILVIGAITVLAYLCYSTAHNLSTTYDNLPAYAQLISEQDTIKIMNTIFYVLCAIDAIIILAVLCMCHRISIAIGTFVLGVGRV
jgi:hypothetical protein